MLCNLGGMCRQFIREFCALTAPIIMFDKDDRFVVMRLEQVSRIIPLAAPIPLSQVVGFTTAGLISVVTAHVLRARGASTPGKPAQIVGQA